jgi:hypothetical protein
MSPAILWITVVMFVVPAAFIWPTAGGRSLFALPALFVIAIYAWIWLRFRPTRFVARPFVLDVIWPLERRELNRHAITEVRLIDRRELRARVGWGMRVGAGGLWGGFGWLWTQRRGIVQMYISRMDGFVLIERVDGRPWLITPERPAEFVSALSHRDSA